MNLNKAKWVVLSTLAAATPVMAYTEDYNTDDFTAIIIDTIATAVVFVKDNLTLIGIMLLFGFVVGAGLAIWMKAKHVIS